MLELCRDSFGPCPPYSRASPAQKSQGLRVVYHKNFSRATFFVFRGTHLVDRYLSYLSVKQIWRKRAVCYWVTLDIYIRRTSPRNGEPLVRTSTFITTHKELCDLLNAATKWKYYFFICSFCFPSNQFLLRNLKVIYLISVFDRFVLHRNVIWKKLYK